MVTESEPDISPTGTVVMGAGSSLLTRLMDRRKSLPGLLGSLVRRIVSSAIQ